ncbi:proteasome-interacting protein cic1 [Coemansia sp. RSA 518]|nr:proteasome-interacting protein cic1 [Coemansia sp. RSA 564]KAJ2229832.1 proteasome-interacting protein cic1 [Coemansia sp. RSA 518]KAJ2406279.1 proteasome-interacting protein cic1 [Coemansia sp. RSA 2526]
MSLNNELVTKAVNSLIAHTKKKEENEESTNLFANTVEPMHLIVTVKKVSHKMRIKPYRIPLRNCLYDESSSVCLIIKNHDEEHVEKLKNLGFPVIKEIVSMHDLKSKYNGFETKRQLMNAHDLFLTDDRVINGLPKALGGKFYLAKKIPAPVNLRAKNLRNEIGKALKCTYYKAARGSCNSVRVGTTDMAPAMLIENTMGTLDNLVKHIPKGWDNIQSVGIKTGTSLTLPIYNALPNASTVISNAAADDDEAMEDVEGETEGAEKKEKKEKKEKASKKSKKSPLSRTKAKNIVKAHAKKRAEATA